MLMICPKCQFENTVGSYRCTNCLALLNLPEQYKDAVSSAAPSAIAIQTSDTSRPAVSNELDARAASATIDPAVSPSDSLEPLTPTKGYRPSGRCPGAAIVRLIITTTTASIFVGALYYLATRYFDMLVLMPLLAGLLVGFVLNSAIEAGKCRSIPIAVALALMAGIITYGTKLGIEAYIYRSTVAAEFAADMAREGALSHQGAAEQADRVLTPYRSFTLYLEAKSYEAFVFSRWGSGGLPLNRTCYYFFLIFDGFVLTGTVIVMLVITASQPFCEKCLQWSKLNLVVIKGPSQSRELVSLVTAQKWEDAHVMPRSGICNMRNRCNAYIVKCDLCNDSHVLITNTTMSMERILLYAQISSDIGRRLIAGNGRLLPVTPAAAPT